MTFENDMFRTTLRNKTISQFKDLSDDKILDTIDYYESTNINESDIPYFDSFTYRWLLKYAKYRNLISIIDENEIDHNIY